MTSFLTVIVDIAATTDRRPDDDVITAGTQELLLDPSSTLPASPHAVVIGVLLSLIALAAVVGNVLVIGSVATDRRLRTITNRFVVSLATADLMVGLLVLPPAVKVEVTGGRWMFGPAMCDVWISFDVMLCTASILNLCCISLDRYLAVTRPLQSATGWRSKRLANIMIGVVWIAAVVITCPPLLGWRETGRHQTTTRRSTNDSAGDDEATCTLTHDPGYVVYSALGSFYVPLGVMLFVYANIFKVVRTRMKPLQPMVGERASADGGSGGSAGSSRRRAEAAAATVVVRLPLDSSSSSLGASCATCCWRRPNDEDSFHVIELGRIDATAARRHDDVGEVRSKSQQADVTPPESGIDLANDGRQPDVLSAEDNRRLGDNSEHRLGVTHCGVDASITATAASAALADGADECTAGDAMPQSDIEQLTPFQSTAALSSFKSAVADPPTEASHLPIAATLSLPVPHLHHHSTDRLDAAASAATATLSSGRTRSGSATHGGGSGTLVSSIHGERSAVHRETKTAKTLSIVVGGFVVCWLPFFVVYLVDPFCKSTTCRIPDQLRSFFTWLGYANSLINPFIYAAYNPYFRSSFWRLTFGLCCRGRRRSSCSSGTGGGSVADYGGFFRFRSRGVNGAGRVVVVMSTGRRCFSGKRIENAAKRPINLSPKQYLVTTF